MSRKKISKREAVESICKWYLEYIYARLVEKYGFKFKGNRPLSLDSFVRFATSSEAKGSLEDIVDMYLTVPKGELKFDKSERRRTEKLAKELARKRMILKEFGLDDSDGIHSDSLVANEVTSNEPDDKLEPGAEVDDIEGDDKHGLAEFQGEMYMLCDGLPWNGAYSVDDCWVRAISVKAKPNPDRVYACVLLHFKGDIGHDEVYQAIGLEDSDDRFSFRNGGEIFKSDNPAL